MLPNFIIIGAQKCGTTSLHHYLDQHDEIVMSKVKELNFFNEELNWSKGLKWYEAHFQGEGKMRGEASPHYTNYPMSPGVAKRMKEIVPDAKIIYLVRDPVERLISAYLDDVKGYLESRDIGEVFKNLKHND